MHTYAIMRDGLKAVHDTLYGVPPCTEDEMILITRNAQAVRENCILHRVRL